MDTFLFLPLFVIFSAVVLAPTISFPLQLEDVLWNLQQWNMFVTYVQNLQRDYLLQHFSGCFRKLLVKEIDRRKMRYCRPLDKSIPQLVQGRLHPILVDLAA